MTTMPPEPPLAVLLGLPFHDLTLAETLEFCTQAMLDQQSRYMVTANVDFTTQAYEDPDLKRIVFFADRVVCDGMPLVWLSRIFGHPLRERVAGSDMVPRLLEICGKAGHGVYFFGSDMATLLEAKGIVEQRYPGLRVVGLDSPPMGAVIEWDNDGLCQRMRESGAKLLLVCLGCPKQERWICAHHGETGIPLSIGVGASLDFFTGKQIRAPRWMQVTGMEWFWRMAGDPKRLASRYGKDLVFLVRAAWRQALSQRRRKSLCDCSRALPPSETAPDALPIPVTRIEWSGDLQRGNLANAPVPEVIDKPVVLNARCVTLMDSSALGQLARLTRACRAAGQLLVLVDPSPAVEASLTVTRMDCLLSIVASDAAAMKLVAEHQAGGGTSHAAADGVVQVSFNRPLDATYHDEMMTVLRSSIENSAGIRVLVVNLKDVSFLDSRAVGGLIRAWKMMVAKGGEMYYAAASPAVAEILRLLRMDQVLKEWKGVPL